jgi:hypothetical protein
MGNAVGKPDQRQPVSTKRWPEQRIDAAMELIMTIDLAMTSDVGRPEISNFVRDSLSTDVWRRGGNPPMLARVPRLPRQFSRLPLRAGRELDICTHLGLIPPHPGGPAQFHRDRAGPFA